MAGEDDSSVQYCWSCGQQLQPEARYCDRCGAAQAQTGGAAAAGEGQTTPHAVPAESEGRSTTKKALLGIGSLVVFIVVSMVVASFVLGLVGTTDQGAGEQTVEDFYQAVANGDEAAVISHIHSDGPVAAELANETGQLFLNPSNQEITAVDSNVVEEGDNRLVLDVELEVDEFGSEPSFTTVRVELRREDDMWKIWAFPEQ